MVGADFFKPKHIVIATWKNVSFAGGIVSARRIVSVLTMRTYVLSSGVMAQFLMPLHIHIRPGLMESKFSTTHFPGPIGALINMLEGFCSQMTL